MERAPQTKRSRRQLVGGVVYAVEPGSIAAQIGIQPGDRILSINGQPLRDVIDYRYAVQDEELTILIQSRSGVREVSVEVKPGEPLGVEFEHLLFDGIRTCHNDCIFCFVKQLPAGLRSSLYVRDDDYRLSFLHGNFITLTNLATEDWERIACQHLSPLYVSVHASSAKVRAELLGIASERAAILDKLQWLLAAGIELHLQIVVVPGVNDGPVLEATLEDLVNKLPPVRSIALVPVGLTKFAPAALRPVTAQDAARIISLVKRYRRKARARWGHCAVQAADELYLLAGKPVPSRAYYEGYPQLENGVGLVRQFLDCWSRFLRRIQGQRLVLRNGRRLVITGALMAPIWEEVAAQMRSLGAQVEVLAVENNKLGSAVTVAGLLFAEDVAAALRRRPGWDQAFLPASMFDSQLEQTLDGLTIGDIAAAQGKPVSKAASAADVLLPSPA